MHSHETLKMSNLTSTPENSSIPARVKNTRTPTSSVPHHLSEGMVDPLTPLERQAVERSRSLLSQTPFYARQIEADGDKFLLDWVWTGPKRYGLA